MKKIVLVIALCAGLVVAQQRAGSLRGQVLDELGGAIVGASVTVIDGKGVEKSVVTNDAGTYTINVWLPASTPCAQSTRASRCLKLRTSKSSAAKHSSSTSL